METLIQYLLTALLATCVIGIWVAIAMAVKASRVTPDVRLLSRRRNYQPPTWKTRTVTRTYGPKEGS